jgi:beta-phosphoglucomutase family hydrolase
VTDLVAGSVPDWSAIDAVLFDLDGVLTPTARVHERAWAETFDAFLADRAPGQRSFSPDDYLSYVDGKPRFDGVRAFVDSRHIDLPEGTPHDRAGHGTIGALGNAKNAAFRRILRAEGIEPYAGSLQFLDAVTRRGTAVAVVSSSRNTPEVLVAAGLAGRFGVVVDGNVLAAEGLAGKPAPDMFLLAARRLATTPARSAVVEDALSGVAAGRAGGFAAVIGVDRGATRAGLCANGATIAVGDLAELVASVAGTG